ncbi:hypothetical protein ACWDRR_02710 [Kitasatospora sp. NPDC003701]
MRRRRPSPAALLLTVLALTALLFAVVTVVEPDRGPGLPPWPDRPGATSTAPAGTASRP